MEAYCCYIGCEKPAKWEIWDSPYPDGDTMACSDHVGHLLDDSHEHRIYPVGRAKSEENADA